MLFYTLAVAVLLVGQQQVAAKSLINKSGSVVQPAVSKMVEQVFSEGELATMKRNLLTSKAPRATPTSAPVLAPTSDETEAPTFEPTVGPTFLAPVATHVPTQVPTQVPTHVPTDAPTQVPTHVPTQVPTQVPTHVPTHDPTYMPTDTPTFEPTLAPVATDVPTQVPTQVPTDAPTDDPTIEPTVGPTCEPTLAPVPTQVPTTIPTQVPTTFPVATVAPSSAAVQSLAPTVNKNNIVWIIIRILQWLFGCRHWWSYNQALFISVMRKTLASALALHPQAQLEVTVMSGMTHSSLAFTSANAAEVGQSLRKGFQRLLQETDDGAGSNNDLAVQYTLSVPQVDGVTYQTVTTSMTESVQSGAFDSTMASVAAQMNAVGFNATAGATTYQNLSDSDKNGIPLGAYVCIAFGGALAMLVAAWVFYRRSVANKNNTGGDHAAVARDSFEKINNTNATANPVVSASETAIEMN